MQSAHWFSYLLIHAWLIFSFLTLYLMSFAIDLFRFYVALLLMFYAIIAFHLMPSDYVILMPAPHYCHYHSPFSMIYAISLMIFCWAVALFSMPMPCCLRYYLRFSDVFMILCLLICVMMILWVACSVMSRASQRVTVAIDDIIVYDIMPDATRYFDISMIIDAYLIYFIYVWCDAARYRYIVVMPRFFFHYCLLRVDGCLTICHAVCLRLPRSYDDERRAMPRKDDARAADARRCLIFTSHHLIIHSSSDAAITLISTPRHFFTIFFTIVIYAWCHCCRYYGAHMMLRLYVGRDTPMLRAAMRVIVIFKMRVWCW